MIVLDLIDTTNKSHGARCRLRRVAYASVARWPDDRELICNMTRQEAIAVAELTRNGLKGLSRENPGQLQSESPDYCSTGQLNSLNGFCNLKKLTRYT